MDTAEIRRRFVAHFEHNQTVGAHQAVPSASLLADDPNLLFVPAGMVPFKPYFLGQETPPYDRAVSIQKCVRTPDIEEVGKTTRHGTFFEMCGNFSFGDYFKEGAIELAWDLVTQSRADGGWGLEESRLWPSILDGDDEALHLWMKVTGLPKERIVRLGRKENYWSMGVPGPGGPCSEILYDRGPEYGPDGEFATTTRTEMPVELEDRYLEIWNLVFMQDELSAVRSKVDFDIRGALPQKNIDTGMGLERVAFLLQGKAEHVRDRRHVPRDRAGDGAHRPPLRRRPGRRRPVPGGRRPRAQLDDAGRRRGHPRQRGPRLRAAPAAAPRRPLGAAARLRGPRAARAAAGQPRQDGGDLPGAPPGLGADLHGGLRRGAGLPADAARRHLDLRPRHHRAEEVRLEPALRRPGVRAARHLRLPDRPHPRDGLRAGALRRRGGLPPADDRAARARQGRREGQEGPAPRRRRLPRGRRLPRPPRGVHRLRPRRRRGLRARSRLRRRGGALGRVRAT